MDTISGQFDIHSLTEGQDGDTRISDNFAARRYGMRHVQIAVMAVATFMVYALRATLNVAIVAMVHPEVDPNSPIFAEPQVQTFDWDEKIQGVVVSAHLWGYILMMIPAGILTERFGGHKFLGVSVLAPSLLTLLLPACAYIGGWQLVCVNKVLQGLGQAFMYPALYALLGVWAPPAERATLSGVALSGGLFGLVAMTPLAGFLAANYGWPSAFYWSGGLSLAVGLLVIFMGADSPANHRWISEAEKDFIHSSLGGAKIQRGIPWKSILTSVPVLTTIITMTGRNMIIFIFTTKVPTYIGTVLKFDLEANGIISSLPNLLSWLLAFWFSWLCDCIVNNGCIGRTTARKVFNSIALFGSAVFLILLASADTSKGISVLLITCFFGIQSAAMPGVQANFVDIAPNFSGTIFSIATFLSSFLGIFSSIGVGFIVTESGSAEQWGIVFYLSAAILVLSNIVFVIWSTAETQPWNWPDKLKDDQTGNEEQLVRSQPMAYDSLASYKTI